MKLTAALMVLVVTGAVSVPARPQAPSPEPDGMSFRRNTTAGSGGRVGARGGQPLRFAPGRAWATSSIWRIILDAYGVTQYQLSGGPAWLDSELYDFDARSTDANAGKEQLKLMLRTLLSQRCHLHREPSWGGRLVPQVLRRRLAMDRSGTFPGALEDELGLKLEAQRAQVDSLVIDHVDRPTEN